MNIHNKNLENSLECPVCIEILNNPRILTCCGHTLCSNCIILISKKNKNQFTLECPVCLKVTNYTDSIENLNKNYTLNNIIEDLKLEKNTSKSLPKENYFIRKKIKRKTSKSLPDLQIYNDENYNNKFTSVSPHIAVPVKENFNFLIEEDKNNNENSIFSILLSSLLKPCDKIRK